MLQYKYFKNVILNNNKIRIYLLYCKMFDGYEYPYRGVQEGWYRKGVGEQSRSERIEMAWARGENG